MPVEDYPIAFALGLLAGVLMGVFGTLLVLGAQAVLR